MTEREHENYVWIVKALSEAGFVWSKAAQAWQRQRDDGAVSDESLRDFVRTWPVFVPRIVAAFESGARIVKIVAGPEITAADGSGGCGWSAIFQAE